MLPGTTNNAAGKPKGCKNKPDLTSLKHILKKCFARNAKLIEQRIDRMLEETSNIEDFKWLMDLKARIEPKEVQIDMPQSQQIVLIRANSTTPIDIQPEKVTTENGSDTRVAEHTAI